MYRGFLQSLRFDPNTPGAAGGGQVKEVDATVKTFVEQAIKTAVEPLVKTVSELPGMSKRHASEAAQAAADEAMKRFMEATAAKKKEEGAAGGEKKEEGKADPAVADMQNQLKVLQDKAKKYEDELAATRTATVTEKKTNEVLKHLAGVKILKSARPMVEEALTKQVKTKEDGTMYMVINQKLDTLGESVPKEVSVADGIAHYFEEHKDLVVTEVSGGVGAANGAAGGKFDGVEYETLMRSPAAVAEFLRTKGQAELNKLRERSRAKK